VDSRTWARVGDWRKSEEICQLGSGHLAARRVRKLRHQEDRTRHFPVRQQATGKPPQLTPIETIAAARHHGRPDVLTYADGPATNFEYRSKADYPYSTRGKADSAPINPGFMGDEDSSEANFAKLTDPTYAYTPGIPAGEEKINRVYEEVSADKGVAKAFPPQESPNGEIALITLFPTTSPQSTLTNELVHRIRADNLAEINEAGGKAHVAGVTAITSGTSTVCQPRR